MTEVEAEAEAEANRARVIPTDSVPLIFFCDIANPQILLITHQLMPYHSLNGKYTNHHIGPYSNFLNTSHAIVAARMYNVVCRYHVSLF